MRQAWQRWAMAGLVYAGTLTLGRAMAAGPVDVERAEAAVQGVESAAPPSPNSPGAALETPPPPPADLVDLAPPADPAWPSVVFYWENDSGAMMPFHRTDRQYTNGTAFSIAAPLPATAVLWDWLPDATPSDRHGVGVSIGQLMFTPDDLEATALIPTDRPYAGYDFLAVYFDRAVQVDAKLTTLDRLRIELGLVGEASLAEDVQESVHDTFNAIPPNGWDNQLNDELTFQLELRRKWKLDMSGKWFDADVIPTAGIALGTLRRQVDLGGTLRLGGNLPGDFGAPRLLDPASGVDRPPPRQGGFMYAFLRCGVAAVEHDLFLDGNTYRNSHSRTLKPLVAEVQLGLFSGWRWRTFLLELGYAQTYESERFVGQTSAHSYGAYMIRCSFEF